MEKRLYRSGLTNKNLENLQSAEAVITNIKYNIDKPNEINITYNQTGINSSLFTSDSVSGLKKTYKSNNLHR